MNKEYSFPKSKIKVLLLEGINPEAEAIFKEEGYQVEKISKALGEDELKEKIKDVSILGIRSKTKVNKEVLKSAKRLLAIGAFCIGTNQIDLKECLKNGICVFNAPYANTRSVVELAMGNIIMLVRRSFEKSMNMHQSNWDKNSNNCFEVRGKTLGIIGYGNIGSQLSILAESMGMNVLYHDIVEKLTLGNAKRCSSLKEVLKKSDVVSLHVDGRESNRNFFGKKEFSLMKKGSYLINLSRGFVVDIDCLAENLKEEKIIGAAIDVFPEEPKQNGKGFQSPLIGLKNVILTPHIGGSTMEAQVNIADFVPKQIIEYVNGGDSYCSVNFPNIKLPEFLDSHRFIHIHRNVPGVLASMNNAFGARKINIVGQYLKTNEEIGYVITDVGKGYDKKLLDDLKKIEGTIKARVLY